MPLESTAVLVIACDRPADLRRLLPGGLLELRGPAPEAVAPVARRLPQVQEAQVFGETLHLLVADPDRDSPEIRAALAAHGFPVVDLRPIVPSLEDVFVTLLRERSGQP